MSDSTALGLGLSMSHAQEQFSNAFVLAVVALAGCSAGRFWRPGWLFEQAVLRGVSANLCDAVAGLSAASPGEGLDIRIAWSRTRPVANTAPSRVFLGSDSMAVIQEAARLFKDTAPAEDVELQGFVTRLAADLVAACDGAAHGAYIVVRFPKPPRRRRTPPSSVPR